MELPCENCIVFAMCKQRLNRKLSKNRLADHLHRLFICIRLLESSCDIFYEYIDTKSKKVNLAKFVPYDVVHTVADLFGLT
jgi:hypothetical protein